MIKQRNRFWTFVFSLIPGCGQMFMGFMKRGLALAAYFWGSILLATSGFEVFAFVIALSWLYAFFDALNLRAADPEVFDAIPDEFLNPFGGENFKDKKHNIPKIVGVLMIFIGLAYLWNSVFMPSIHNVVGDSGLYNLLYLIGRRMPAAVICVIAIIVGVKLISGKKHELEEESDV